MLKKIFSLLICLLITVPFYSQANSTVIKFLKGNISDKTAAVREASGEDAAWLSNKAIEFVLENKEILGNDREVDRLAVAAVFSISSDYVKYLTDSQKTTLEKQFIQLFSEFNESSTVQISVLNKVVALKDYCQMNDFINILNNYLKTNMIQDIDSSVFKAILTTFESVGNKESFIILYNFLNNQKYASYHSQLQKSISELIPACMNETIALIQTSTTPQLNVIYNLALKNSKISKNNLCEISEKVLSKSILLIDSTSSITPEDIDIQIKALNVLTENKWTRASVIVISYFRYAKVQFTNGIISEEQFISTIESLSNVAPIDSVSSLTQYLEELNVQKERGNFVSIDLVVSVIKTLGAIGDKAAFDSLLAVTYLNYDESVLTAAREALSGLRW